MTKRMTKDELREDRVATAAAQAVELVKRNAKWLAIAIGVAAVVLVVAILVAQGRTRSEREAAVAMYQAQSLYLSGDFAQAATQFQTIADRHGSARSARTARLLEGNAQMALGNPQAAAEAFRKFLDKDPAGIDEAAALRGLAATLEQQGQVAEAAETYSRAAQVEENSLAGHDWLQAGRSYAAAGDAPKAAEAFGRVIRDYPGSGLVNEARVLLAEVEAAAR